MDQLQKYDKQFHYENAKVLLVKEDYQSLRYACLKLRYFIEAHVYLQLLASADKIPKTVIETWQPNKAIKLLSQFNGMADMDVHLTIGSEDGEFSDSITYNNIPIKELNKTYNSLGSYLHLPMPKKLNEYNISKEKIVQIFDKLERLTGGDLMVVDTGYEHFQCEACLKDIIYTLYYIENQDSIVCQNDACKIEHAIRKSETSVSFGSKHIFECGVCHEEASVYFSKIEDGYNFNCEHCGTEYKFEMVLNGTPAEEIKS